MISSVIYSEPDISHTQLALFPPSVRAHQRIWASVKHRRGLKPRIASTGRLDILRDVTPLARSAWGYYYGVTYHCVDCNLWISMCFIWPGPSLRQDTIGETIIPLFFSDTGQFWDCRLFCFSNLTSSRKKTCTIDIYNELKMSISVTPNYPVLSLFWRFLQRVLFIYIYHFKLKNMM